MEQILKELLKKSDNIEFIEKHLESLPLPKVQQIFLQLLDEEYFSFAEICLKYVKDVNFGNTHDGENANPLIKMCWDGNLEAVKFLVKNGANMEHLSENKTTAIMYAYQEGYLDIVKFLYSLGAKIVVGTKKMTDFTPVLSDIKNYRFFLELLNYFDEIKNSLQEKINYEKW